MRLSLLVLVLLAAVGCTALTERDPVTGKTPAGAALDGAAQGVDFTNGLGLDDLISALVGAATGAAAVIGNNVRRQRAGK